MKRGWVGFNYVHGVPRLQPNVVMGIHAHIDMGRDQGNDRLGSSEGLIRAFNTGKFYFVDNIILCSFFYIYNMGILEISLIKNRNH